MTSRIGIGALGAWPVALLATVSLTACASGSQIAIATTATAPTIAGAEPEDQNATFASRDGGYLIASGNVLLPWRDPASGGMVLSSQGGVAPTSPAGLGARLDVPSANLALATPAAALAAQTALAPGGVVTSAAVSSPVLGVQAGAGLTGSGLSANLAATGQPLTALGVGGLLAPVGPVTLVAGPVNTSIANPNTVAGALLTDLTGAVMQLGGTPSGPMAPATVPSVQNLGAVLNLLKPPGL